MSGLYLRLKHLTPDFVKTKIIWPLRQAMEVPGIEADVLRPCGFVAENSPRARLTLVLPSLSQKEAFGGVTTALQFFLTLSRELQARGATDIRIMTEHSVVVDDNVLPGILSSMGMDVSDVAVGSLRDTGNKIPTRKDEIFLPYNWWIALNTAPILEAQAIHFTRRALPKLYLIQEYEPQFYAFSSAHLLSLHAFNGDWPLWGVFNSSELHSYYMEQGNRADKAFVFEPRMAPKIRAFADGIDVAEKTRTILVYGRPQIPRNCFSLLEAGLKAWAASGDRSGWRVVSAGASHRVIDLGHGQKLTSLGKLSLEEYGQLLRETAVGLSLMSSPHPSYPPLELAHFGARTITNAYANKNLTSRHENLLTLSDVLPTTIGAKLGATTDRFEAEPGLGLSAKSHMPDYMSDPGFDCMEAVVRTVSDVLFTQVTASAAE